jgi:molybdopterin converting factor small subunit
VVLAATARYNSRVPSPEPEPTIAVKVLFFGRLREIVGLSEVSMDLSDGSPIDVVFARFVSTHPELADFRASLVASRNREFAPWTAPLHCGDEVAFLPPVSGG